MSDSTGRYTNSTGPTPAHNLVDSAYDAGRRSIGVIHAGSEYHPCVVVRDSDGGERLIDLPRHIRPEHPDAKRGTIMLDDAESFIDEYQRHADDSRIYASLNPARIVAVIDAHRPRIVDDEPMHNGGARWQTFRLVYQPRLTDAWQQWAAHDGKPFESNVAFGEWLEDMATDIVKPAGAEMLQMALTMRVQQNAAWSGATTLANGAAELAFHQTVDGSATSATGGKVKIPDEFTVKVPIFESLTPAPQEITARLRYRLAGATLRIWYQLHRPNTAVTDAFRSLIKRIGKATGTTVLLGKPD